MKRARYGVGTYILREEASKDLFGVLEKLARIGYDGVELLGFFSKVPSDIRKKMDDLGICALGDHVDFDKFILEPEKVIDDHLEAGCAYITIAHREGQFVPGTAAFDDMLTGMRRLIKQCLAAGITPQYHNHGWDVRNPSYVDSLCLEPDLGWMVYSSADPADYLRRYKDRCRVIHLKDVYADDYRCVMKNPGTVRRDPGNGGFEFRPTGYGTVNFSRLMPLCMACNPDWLMVDHDLAYERDPYEDLRISLEYLKALAPIAR